MQDLCPLCLRYTVSPERQLELRVELGVKRLCYEAQTVSPV